MLKIIIKIGLVAGLCLTSLSANAFRSGNIVTVEKGSIICFDKKDAMNSYSTMLRLKRLKLFEFGKEDMKNEYCILLNKKQTFKFDMYLDYDEGDKEFALLKADKGYEAVVLSSRLTKATSSSQSSSQSSQPMDYEDFIIDYDTLVGQKVKVKGFLLAQGGMMNFLYARPGTVSAIHLDFTSLSRKLRKKALKVCSRGCSGTVIEGIVGNVNYQKGIKVTGIGSK